MADKTKHSGGVQSKDAMSLTEAQEYAKALNNWAKKRWGVETERKYVCPLDGYSHDYEGYCSNDGRKLQEKQVECQTQKWRHNLDDFMYMPEYPAEASQEVTT